MNKIFYLLLIALIVCYIKCNDYCDGNDPSGTSVDYCTSRKVNDGDYRCCFLEFSGGQCCEPVTKGEYDEIDDYIDLLESGGLDDVDIDCGSKYIINSLLALILILL